MIKNKPHWDRQGTAIKSRSSQKEITKQKQVLSICSPGAGQMVGPRKQVDTDLASTFFLLSFHKDTKLPHGKKQVAFIYGSPKSFFNFFAHFCLLALYCPFDINIKEI